MYYKNTTHPNSPDYEEPNTPHDIECDKARRSVDRVSNELLKLNLEARIYIAQLFRKRIPKISNGNKDFYREWLEYMFDCIDGAIDEIGYAATLHDLAAASQDGGSYDEYSETWRDAKTKADVRSKQNRIWAAKQARKQDV